MEPDNVLPQISPVRCELTLDAGRLDIAEIRLSGLPRAAVLLLCAAGGLDAEAPELMNRLAQSGFESLACDVSPLSLDDDGRRSVVRTLVGAFEARGWTPDQVGIVGYGDGGRAALLAAEGLGLGAVVALSPVGLLEPDGGPSLTQVAAQASTPCLGMFGALDADAPDWAVKELAARSAGAPAYTRCVVYSGVGADFFRDAPDSVGHSAAFDAWQRVIEWLNAQVSPRLSPHADKWKQRRRPERGPLHRRPSSDDDEVPKDSAPR